MKTTEFSDPRAISELRRRQSREQKLYPSLRETERIQRQYRELGLDIRVLKAAPKKDVGEGGRR